MNKKLMIFLTLILIAIICMGCGKDSQPIVVNVDNNSDLSGTIFGREALIHIDGYLYYDATTRIVYWWNGYLDSINCTTTPTAYYAPNGFPYRYDPETNTFEEIECPHVNELVE